MADDILLGEKTYVSSKKAAQACGYAQDYVGQLARGGVIDAQRVGGLWYVSMESLEAYKRNAEAFTPQPPAQSKSQIPVDTIVNFDGKDYISAARAAKLTGYNPDYVGQLARGGKILSRQVGNRWYIERNGLLAHKSQKDALLAGVQAEAVGLAIPELAPAPKADPFPTVSPYYTYHTEDHALLPTLSKPEIAATPARAAASETLTQSTVIPIRVVQEKKMPVVHDTEERKIQQRRVSGTAMRTAVKSVAALTVVIVVSYGFVSIKSDSIYAFLRMDPAIENPAESMLGNASLGAQRVLDLIEELVTNEVHFSR